MKLSEINLMDKYPRSKRNIEERVNLIKEEHREIARKFEKDFFDGDRLYGYGGYNYHPRFWQETVKRFSEFYKLDKSASILDVGCGKGFMLHDFQEFSSTYTVAGIDVSKYAVENAMDSVKKYLQVGDAKEIPFEEVFDKFAIRIIIDCSNKKEKELCWRTYSVVTDFYQPNPDRLRDWISNVKVNGYESLHTTVMGMDGSFPVMKKCQNQKEIF